MIEYAQALALILEHAHPLEHEMRMPSEALGRIVAAPVMSQADLPPFDNSAMDGYALVTAGASIPADTILQVTAYQAAGDPQVSSVSGVC